MKITMATPQRSRKFAVCHRYECQTLRQRSVEETLHLHDDAIMWAIWNFIKGEGKISGPNLSLLMLINSTHQYRTRREVVKTFLPLPWELKHQLEFAIPLMKCVCRPMCGRQSGPASPTFVRTKFEGLDSVTWT